MVRIDENQEAIARIRLSVDLYDAARLAAIQEQNENDGEELPVAVVEGVHWKLGSPLQLITAREWEKQETSRLAFRNFEVRLVCFLQEYLPEQSFQQPLKARISSFFGQSII